VGLPVVEERLIKILVFVMAILNSLLLFYIY